MSQQRIPIPELDGQTPLAEELATAVLYRPTVAEVVRQGQWARRFGRTEADCPYPAGSIAAWAWTGAWPNGTNVATSDEASAEPQPPATPAESEPQP